LPLQKRPQIKKISQTNSALEMTPRVMNPAAKMRSSAMIPLPGCKEKSPNPAFIAWAGRPLRKIYAFPKSHCLRPGRPPTGAGPDLMVRIAIGRFTDRANRQSRCRSKADPTRLRRQSKLRRQTRQLASDRATHLRQLTISIPSHRVARQIQSSPWPWE
jgi:hypothetical protein